MRQEKVIMLIANENETTEQLLERMLDLSNTYQKIVYGMCEGLLWKCYSYYTNPKDIKLVMSGGGYCV